MMHNVQGLYDQLRINLNEVESQIKAIKAGVTEDFERGRVMEDAPYKIVRSDGTPVLEPMLAAKAQILSGLAALKAADVNGRVRR